MAASCYGLSLLGQYSILNSILEAMLACGVYCSTLFVVDRGFLLLLISYGMRFFKRAKR